LKRRFIQRFSMPCWKDASAPSIDRRLEYEAGSLSRIRTYDHSINSRELYR